MTDVAKMTNIELLKLTRTSTDAALVEAAKDEMYERQCGRGREAERAGHFNGYRGQGHIIAPGATEMED
jgi:hypothetical protein